MSYATQPWPRKGSSEGTVARGDIEVPGAPPLCMVKPSTRVPLAENLFGTTSLCKRRGGKALAGWPPGCKARMEPVEQSHAGNHPWCHLGAVPALHQVGQDLPKPDQGQQEESQHPPSPWMGEGGQPH